MRPRGSGEGYYSQPRPEFNRGSYNNYPQPAAPRSAMYPPSSHSVDKGPYIPPNSYRPQYPKPMGMMSGYIIILFSILHLSIDFLHYF